MSNYRAKAARIREQKRNARILERLQNDFAAQLAIRDYRIAALEHQIHALVQTINCFRFPYPLPFSFFQNPLYFNFSTGSDEPEWTVEQNCKGCADLLRAYWEAEAKRLDNERSNTRKKTRYSSIPKEFRPTT